MDEKTGTDIQSDTEIPIDDTAATKPFKLPRRYRDVTGIVLCALCGSRNGPFVSVLVAGVTRYRCSYHFQPKQRQRRSNLTSGVPRKGALSKLGRMASQ